MSRLHSPLRGGDPTLASSSSPTAEEEFLLVLEEIQRIDGLEDVPPSASQSACSFLLSSEEPSKFESSPLEPLFGCTSDDNEHGDNATLDSSQASSTFFDGLMGGGGAGDDYLSYSPDLQQQEQAKFTVVTINPRSRNYSGTSSVGLSCASFDSAIVDDYSVETPSPSLPSVPPMTFDIDEDMVMGPPPPTPATVVMTPTAVEETVTSSSGSADPRSIKNPLRGKQRRPPSRPQQPLPPPPAVSAPPANVVPPSLLNLVQQRQAVEMVCNDLVGRFQRSSSLHPKQVAREWMSNCGGEDPLLITTRLLSDALTRLRIFLYELEPMQWLTWPDRHALYNGQICAVSILKASLCVDASTLPLAYPLPYGQSFDEGEAIHLVLAYNLYNELKTMISELQQLVGLRELPVMLLAIMVAFFSTQPNLQQADKVVRIHDFYTLKLQTYLNLKYGLPAGQSAMRGIMAAINKVKNFSARLREFMTDVTRSGLQREYDAICENIGLIAFVLQTEQPEERVA